MLYGKKCNCAIVICNKLIIRKPHLPENVLLVVPKSSVWQDYGVIKKFSSIYSSMPASTSAKPSNHRGPHISWNEAWSYDRSGKRRISKCANG